MRILFIRHGDPDYEHDTLTVKGHREAALLAESAANQHLGECFVSPLGRAQDTAAYCLRKLGITAQTLDWLHEFPSHLDLNRSVELRPLYPGARIVDGVYQRCSFWDVLPSHWAKHPEYLDPIKWRETPIARAFDMPDVYDQVTGRLDQFLAERGYVKDGLIYRVEKESTETVTFFCHYAISCALISHIWNVSPFSLWFQMQLAPTSVTELVTEERESGIAIFRSQRIGDISHLYAGQEPPSFAGRFCEIYSNMDERH